MTEQLILTKEHLTNLETHLKDQPWKFANPILAFLSEIRQQQIAAEEIATQAKAEDVEPKVDNP